MRTSLARSLANSAGDSLYVFQDKIPNSLRTGLLAWYALNEASGNGIDSGPNGYTLTQTGTVGSTTGKVGNCRTNNATAATNLQNTTATPLWANNATLTWSFWALVPTAPAGEQTFGGALSGGNYVYCGIRSDMTMRVQGSGGGFASALITPAITAGVWNFISCGYHHAAQQLFWSVNNGAESLQSHTFGTDGGNNFTLFDGVSGPANVQLDEWVIHNRRLTAAERAFLYNSGNGRQYSEIL